MISRRIVCRDHVGRSVESKHLLDRRRDAARGRGGLVLVRGEPGIGKSRLVAAFADELRAPTTVARIECRPFAQLPLAPLEDLSAALGSRARAAADSLEERIRTTADAFRTLAERGTVVAIVEDLHWAHSNFLEVLAALARTAASCRLLVVATYRAEELGSGHAGFATLGRMVRDPATSIVELEPLDDAATRRLLVASVDERYVPDELRLAAIVRRCGGNPLFAEELLRDAIDGATLDGSNDVPLSIRGIVAERLNRCTAQEVSVASAAALAGRRFRLDVLAGLGPEFAEGGHAIQKLCDLQLVDADASDANRFVFRHALVRDAIAATVPPATRGRLHTAIASALAGRADSAEYALEIASHYFAAGQREADAFARAGAAARSNLDFAGSIVWYERAADAAARASDRAAAVDARIKAAAAAIAGLDDATGQRKLADVIAFASESRDLGTLVRASRMLAGNLNNDGRHAEATRVLQTALEAVGDAEPAYANSLHIRLAAVLEAHHEPQPLARALGAVVAGRLEERSLDAAEYHVLRAVLAARTYDLATWRTEHAIAEAVEPSILSAGAWKRYAYGNECFEASALGDLQRSEQLIALAADAASLSMGPNTDLAAMRSMCALARGDAVACERAIDELPRRGLLVALRFRTIASLGLALLRDDRDALASNLDGDLLVRVRASGHVTSFAALAIAYAEAENALGRPAAALRLVDEALARVSEPYGLVPSLLSAARLNQEVATRCGAILERDERALSLPFFIAARELTIAERHRVSDPQLAAASASSAGAIFEATGWRRLAMRARELAGDVVGAATIARETDDVAARRRYGLSAASSELSDREREIAGLVARGETNRKIAVALSISEKTVEKHLTTIYEKLAVRSRTELAVTLTKI